MYGFTDNQGRSFRRKEDVQVRNSDRMGLERAETNVEKSNVDTTSHSSRIIAQHRRLLESMCDVLVNDDLSCCSSRDPIVSLDQSIMGPSLANEIQVLSKLTEREMKSFTVLVGGQVTLPKLCMLINLLPRARHIVLGGEISRAARIVLSEQSVSKHLSKWDVGDSKPPPKYCYSLIRQIFKLGQWNSVTIHLHQEMKNEQDEEEGKDGDDDVESKKDTETLIQESNEILWVGMFGKKSSRSILKALQELKDKDDTLIVVAGDDTSRFLESEDASDDVSLCSTGGRSVIRLLAGERLPGIASLRECESGVGEDEDDDDEEEEEEKLEVAEGGGGGDKEGVDVSGK